MLYELVQVYWPCHLHRYCIPPIKMHGICVHLRFLCHSVNSTDSTPRQRDAPPLQKASLSSTSHPLQAFLITSRPIHIILSGLSIRLDALSLFYLLFPPHLKKMAFVPPVTLLSNTQTLTGAAVVQKYTKSQSLVSYPCQPCRRATVMQARCSPQDPTPVSINRVLRQQDLQHVYNVWNTVASAEGFPRVSPDEGDAAESTIHLLARYAPTASADDHYNEGKFVGAARLLYVGDNNVRLDRVCVLPDWRERGIGRALVNQLLSLADGTHGAIHVHATRGSESGFFSILGFEPVGNDRIEESLGNTVVRTMLLKVPTCAAPSDAGSGCIGLHHTSLRVSDIEHSLAFYGSIGFTVSEKFLTSSGARACFVEGLGTRLEFVECRINNSGGHLAGVQGVPPTGFDRLVFDVTKACTDLETYLQHLQRRNGGVLEVAGPPAKQVVGNNVMAVASIYDPDGMPIEFIRREAQVPGELVARVKW